MQHFQFFFRIHLSVHAATHQWTLCYGIFTGVTSQCQDTMQKEGSNYTIRVRGRLSEQWTEWFSDMAVTYADGITTLSGPVEDQAALHGILARIRDLGLSLIDVRREMPE